MAVQEHMGTVSLGIVAGWRLPEDAPVRDASLVLYSLTRIERWLKTLDFFEGIQGRESTFRYDSLLHSDSPKDQRTLIDLIVRQSPTELRVRQIRYGSPYVVQLLLQHADDPARWGVYLLEALTLAKVVYAFPAEAKARRHKAQAESATSLETISRENAKREVRERMNGQIVPITTEQIMAEAIDRHVENGVVSQEVRDAIVADVTRLVDPPRAPIQTFEVVPEDKLDEAAGDVAESLRS